MPSESEHPNRSIHPRSKQPRTATPASGQSWFFGIGINEYRHFENLHNAVKDVKDVMILLQDRYDLEPDHIITLFDEAATRKQIIKVLDSLVERIQENDKLIIYYSGHGHLNKKSGKGYWIPCDAEKENTSAYIRNSTIREYLQDIKSLHTLLISDSCFSGALFVRSRSGISAAVEELEKLPSRWAICSGRHNEEVHDGAPGTNSPFAASILNLLRVNQDPRLNVAKLADNVRKLTYRNYTQLPEGRPLYGVGDQGGEYVFRLRSDEESFWEECRRENTLKAYNAFLDMFPEGKYAGQALQHIKELEEQWEWERARRIDKIYAYRDFIFSFPQGKYQEEARGRIQALSEERPERESPVTREKSAIEKQPREKPKTKPTLHARRQNAKIGISSSIPRQNVKEWLNFVGVGILGSFIGGFGMYFIVRMASPFIALLGAVIAVVLHYLSQWKKYKSLTKRTQP